MMPLFQPIHRLRQCRSQHLYIAAHCVQLLAAEQTPDIGQIQLPSSSQCPESQSTAWSALSFFAKVQSANKMLQRLNELTQLLQAETSVLTNFKTLSFP